MTAKRDTGRQRRVNQNRAAREALTARRQAAAQKAQPEPEPVAKRGRGRSRAQAAPVVAPNTRAGAEEAESGRSERPARSRFTPPPSLDDVPPAKGIRARAEQLAGGRQMLAGFVLILVASAVAGFVPMFREKGKTHNESFFQLVGARALLLLAVPVVIAAVPLMFLNHRRRRVAWNIAVLLIGLWILLIPGLGIYYLFGAGSMGWGVMKASRAEGPVGMGFGGLRRLGRRAPSGPRTNPDGTLETDGSEVAPGSSAD